MRWFRRLIVLVFGGRDGMVARVRDTLLKSQQTRDEARPVIQHAREMADEWDRQLDDERRRRRLQLELDSHRRRQ